MGDTAKIDAIVAEALAGVRGISRIPSDIRDVGTHQDQLDLSDEVVITQGQKKEEVTVRDYLYLSSYWDFGRGPVKRLQYLAMINKATHRKYLPLSHPLRSHINAYQADRKKAVEERDRIFRLASLERYRRAVTFQLETDKQQKAIRRYGKLHHIKLTFKANYTGFKDRLYAFEAWSRDVWRIPDILKFNELLGNDIKKLLKKSASKPEKVIAIILFLPPTSTLPPGPEDKTTRDLVFEDAEVKLYGTMQRFKTLQD